jgi:hypothetical protein
MSWIKKKVKKIVPRPLREIQGQIRAHWKCHRAVPNLINPATFSDKVLYRRLFDRRPLLPQLAGKATVRAYVESRLGPDVLPKLYYLTIRPETIPFDQLPDRFVVKPTHGSGWLQIVTDKSTLDRAALIDKCKVWLKRSYAEEKQEWVYQDIEPQIIVEEFIDDGSGTAPNDYKLFVFDGTVRMIQVDTGRFTDHRRRLFTPTWEKLDALLLFDDVIGDVPCPRHLTDIITAAQKLGKGLDFVRADFYDTPKRIYFGEFTFYPDAGLGRFRPQDFDRRLGGYWKLA